MPHNQTKESIEWLSKRLKNEYDIKALKQIADSFNELLTTRRNEQKMFTKLYIYSLFMDTLYYKDIDIARKHLSEILEFPQDYHINNLKRSLNNMAVIDFNNLIGYSDTHPYILNNDPRRHGEHEANKKLIEENPEMFKKLLIDGVYSFEKTKELVMEDIDAFILKYRLLD